VAFITISFTNIIEFLTVGIDRERFAVYPGFIAPDDPAVLRDVREWRRAHRDARTPVVMVQGLETLRSVVQYLSPMPFAAVVHDNPDALLQEQVPPLDGDVGAQGSWVARPLTMADLNEALTLSTDDPYEMIRALDARGAPAAQDQPNPQGVRSAPLGGAAGGLAGLAARRLDPGQGLPPGQPLPAFQEAAPGGPFPYVDPATAASIQRELAAELEREKALGFLPFPEAPIEDCPVTIGLRAASSITASKTPICQVLAPFHRGEVPEALLGVAAGYLTGKLPVTAWLTAGRAMALRAGVAELDVAKLGAFRESPAGKKAVRALLAADQLSDPGEKALARAIG